MSSLSHFPFAVQPDPPPLDDDGLPPYELVDPADAAWWASESAAGDPDADELLPLAEWLEARAVRLDADGPRGAWLARRVRDLAGMARHLGAATCDAFDGRLEALEDARDARHYDRGYAEGARGLSLPDAIRAAFSG